MVRTVAQCLILRFPPRKRCGGAPLEIFNFYLLLITWPTKLKFCIMLLDIGAHSRSVPDSDFRSGGAVGARFLKSWNRFTACSSYPIELKLCRMILDINPHNRSEPDFSISFQGRCGGAPFAIFKSIHSLPFFSDWAETWQDDTMSPPNHLEPNSPISSTGAVRAGLLKFSNQFTAYSIYSIELKLGAIILDINLHNRY